MIPEIFEEPRHISRERYVHDRVTASSFPTFRYTKRLLSFWKKMVASLSPRCGILPFLLLGICLEAGCAYKQPLIRPPEKPAPALRRAEDVIQLMIKNYGDIDSLKASGKIKAKLPGEKRWKKASFALVLEKPDKLRLRAYRPLLPPLFEIVSDGQDWCLFLPDRDPAYVNEGKLSLRPGTILDAIVVVSDFDALLSLPVVMDHEGDLIVLVFEEDSGRKRKYWINPESGLVERQLVSGVDGMPQVDIAYEQYRFEENISIPSTMEIILPQEDTSISLLMDDSKLNSEIPSGAFEIPSSKESMILEK